ncbi:CD209 antigen-like protein E isoform X10 [Ctenopharyngodon idella]|uniref:Immune-related lectin-like receptor 1 n=1 Tax=Ctenopharyngodon idella TaxID=7959 RepID=A0A8A5LLR9_CTEID|nr:CD209 antigen-like protein E isoform X9 [Ctenopharyngodon idella]XP_051729698.1 CD209 antigen-like protein E isoform X10 [Ctenopharyngodon idella]QTF80131.1 immune-related lectin-like receptor 1 [Ctenopharyngodon idella]
MDVVYGNSDYIRSATSSSDKCSRYKDQKTFKKEAALHKWAKVLLIVLSVCLVFALGSVCTLAVLLTHATHFNVSVSDQGHNATDYKEQFDVLHNQHEETLRKLNRLNHSTGCALCSVHWIHFGGKCYFFSTVKMNWTQSRDHCVTLGGHLVIINSQAEQDFLTSKVKVTHWIGLNDLDTEGHWFWVNNQPLNDSVEFWIKRENGVREPDNWTKGHPAGEDCASLGHPAGETDFWTDAFCFQEKRFVCEAAAAV